ncbi:MAG TPA: hypothetical protein PK620_07955 [Denitromonas sp.]|nr:hypothetical protein [Rhodocyclaceae bacterium]MCP5221144.1 hypothetical protein [Zoogloeaceae bacterium]HPR05987.1 hypothetical protein [Denitromonas sp.]HQU87994.1 hypothetical protein [Denitromonas sp.]HQV14836.1 hypothetical protein [Denitromonas sp.]
MSTLNGIGKDAVVKYHKDVFCRLLEPVPDAGAAISLIGLRRRRSERT